MTTYSWSPVRQDGEGTLRGPTLPAGTGYVGEIIDAGAKIPKSGKPRPQAGSSRCSSGRSPADLDHVPVAQRRQPGRASPRSTACSGRLGIDLSRSGRHAARGHRQARHRREVPVRHRAPGGQDRRHEALHRLQEPEADRRHPGGAPAPPVAPPAPAPAPPRSRRPPDVAALQAQLAAQA